MKKFIIYLFLCFFTVILISCTTLQQDKTINTIFTEEIEEVVVIEQTVYKMDCAYILEKNGFTSQNHFTILDYEDLILQIDNLLLEEGLLKQSKAMLNSLKGRIYLFEEKKARAKACFDIATSLYKGEYQTIILGSRLNIYSNPKEINTAKEYLPYFILEEGIKKFIEKDYLGTVAKFDQAYLGISSRYRENYQQIRNEAWKLKDIKQNETDNKILFKESLTIGEMLQLTQLYSNQLYNYTSGKKLTEQELYNKVIKEKLLEPCNGKNIYNIKYTSPVTKILCARFLWNLYCNNQNIPKNIFETDFEEESSSPIKDVEINDNDFCAIVGCIQEEFMDLEKGLYFNPQDSISGIEYKSYIMKLK